MSFKSYLPQISAKNYCTVYSSVQRKVNLSLKSDRNGHITAAAPDLCRFLTVPSPTKEVLSGLNIVRDLYLIHNFHLIVPLSRALASARWWISSMRVLALVILLAHRLKAGAVLHPRTGSSWDRVLAPTGTSRCCTLAGFPA